MDGRAVWMRAGPRVGSVTPAPYTTALGHEFDRLKNSLGRHPSSVYVSDAAADRVQNFTGSSQYLATFGGSGSGDGQFLGPLGISVRGTDLYVVDENNCRVQVLTTSGLFRSTFGSTRCSGTRVLYEPIGIAVDSSGIYVGDTGENGGPAIGEAHEQRRAFGSLAWLIGKK